MRKCNTFQSPKVSHLKWQKLWLSLIEFIDSVPCTYVQNIVYCYLDSCIECCINFLSTLSMTLHFLTQPGSPCSPLKLLQARSLEDVGSIAGLRIWEDSGILLRCSKSTSLPYWGVFHFQKWKEMVDLFSSTFGRLLLLYNFIPKVL